MDGITVAELVGVHAQTRSLIATKAPDGLEHEASDSCRIGGIGEASTAVAESVFWSRDGRGYRR